MKRKATISLILVLLVCSVLTIYFVAKNKAVNRTDGEGVNVILEESSVNREDENEMENDTHIINVSSHEKIQSDKIEIIQILNDNYDLFCQVVSYFENSSGRYFCTKESGELVIEKYYDGRPSFRVDNIGEIEVGEQIEYILNDLGFE